MIITILYIFIVRSCLSTSSVTDPTGWRKGQQTFFLFFRSLFSTTSLTGFKLSCCLLVLEQCCPRRTRWKPSRAIIVNAHCFPPPGSRNHGKCTSLKRLANRDPTVLCTRPSALLLCSSTLFGSNFERYPVNKKKL